MAEPSKPGAYKAMTSPRSCQQVSSSLQYNCSVAVNYLVSLPCPSTQPSVSVARPTSLAALGLTQALPRSPQKTRTMSPHLGNQVWTQHYKTYSHKVAGSPGQPAEMPEERKVSTQPTEMSQPGSCWLVSDQHSFLAPPRCSPWTPTQTSPKGMRS